MSKLDPHKISTHTVLMMPGYILLKVRVKRDISIIFVILGFSLELKIKSQVFLTHPTIAAYNIRK